MDKDIYLENETKIVAHCNSKIITTRRYNCSANVILLVSWGFINLMYFNPCLLQKKTIVTQMMRSHSFCKSFWSSFHLYLKFIWQLEKGLYCTAVSHLQWIWEPTSRLQMSPHCHLTVNDWNLLPVVSGAENCHGFLQFIMYCLNWKHFPDWIDLLENSIFILKMQDCCNILFKKVI